MTVTAETGTSAPADRGSPRRVAALAGLLFLAVIALRGRLPEAGPGDPGPTSGGSPVTTAAVLLLLSVSMLITAVALLTRPPRRRVIAPLEERRLPIGAVGWSLRRVLILVAGLVTAVLIAALLRGLLPQVGVPGAPRAPERPPAGAIERPGESPRPSAPAPPDDVLVYLAAAVAVMAVLMVLSAVLARRRRPPEPEPVVPESRAVPPGPEPLVVAAERGLAAVEDLSRSPREAIIACYVAMEKALAEAPGAAPRDSDTPSEVLARAVENRTVQAGGAAQLVAVFAEARFSTHTMTEHHREVAEHALRAVLAELRDTR